MSYKAFNKEIRRSITGSLGRFIAICAIVALGVGFFCGIQMTSIDMERSSDAFFDGTDLMDIRVVSTMGLSSEDLEEIAKIDGVEEVEGAYETDVVADIREEPYTIRIHSLPESAKDSKILSDVEIDSDDEGYLNRPILAQGEWPNEVGECVISADRIMNTPAEIGDTIKISSTESDVDGVLKTLDYKIVGKVHSSYYASSTNMGTTSLGAGTLQQFMYVGEEDFDDDYPFTEAFVTVVGAKDLQWTTGAYEDLVSEVESRIEAIAEQREQVRFNELKYEAQEELDSSRDDYESERADAEAKLADAQAKLESARADIEEGERQLQRGRGDYASGQAELASWREDAESRFDAAQSEIDSGIEMISNAQTQLDEQIAQLEAMRPFMTEEQIAAAEAQIQDAKSAIDSKTAQLQSAQSALDNSRVEVYNQFASAQDRLNEAAGEIASSEQKLQNGKADYASGLSEYESSRAEADEKFADAEAKLADAQTKIDEIEMPEWLVMSRSENYGAESYRQDAERIGNLAQVFPLIFFLVAALVALTSMTRMVDEERMQIGTYKALGYSRGRITWKYLAYALIASTLGCVFGIVALSFALPAFIMYAYSIVYIVPTAVLGLDWHVILLSIAIGVGVTLVATLAAALSTLRETPAYLMLPKAPKAGKQILLQRIKPLWSHLSFLMKVTLRNLFRYKKRMLMTVIGIAGCTALLLTGFGLYNSINDIIDKQFGNIVSYNMTIKVEEGLSGEKLGDLEKEISNIAHPSEIAYEYAHAISVEHNGSSMHAEAEVPIDVEKYEQLHIFKNRLTDEVYDLEVDGALLTEKLASRIGVNVGDTVELFEMNTLGRAVNKIGEVKVAGIIENYVQHYIYMTPETYRQATSLDVSANTIVMKADIQEDMRSEVRRDLSALDGVKTVSYTYESVQTYKDALSSVNYVVIILIVAAALLAFIVLYNLTNINITERIREIATLKVLGFTKREIYTYIFREIAILALIGDLFGLALGVFLESFVVTTVEVDEVMFGREIHIASFIISFALTMVFTWIVTLFMRRKLDRIDMVESLKSNE